jgi:Zn-dependent protease with chaperone function
MQSAIDLAPRRSLILPAALSILIIFASYFFLLLLAGLSVYLPYWLLDETTSAGSPFSGIASQFMLLLLGGVIVAASIVWSLLPRRMKFQPPGVLLDRATNARLFAEVDAVSNALNEPAPSEIYLMAAANAYVAEVGGVLAFGKRRIMALGLPLVSVLSVSEFRALLAHESAHFYSGDTSLAPWVYRARLGLLRTIQNMEHTQEVIHLQAFRVMAVLARAVIEKYFILFLRMTGQISRQQELRADELACWVAGRESARSCLEKIHATDLLWTIYWTAAVEPVLKHRFLPDLAEGFRRFLANSGIAGHFKLDVTDELESPEPDRFSSHPPLARRVLAIEKMEAPERTLDDTLASSLFDGLHLAERSLVEFSDLRTARGTLSSVAWDDVASQVTIPSWRAEVAALRGLITGVTAAALPEFKNNLSKITSRMPDPQGRLLTVREREHRAVHLLGIAVTLLLLHKGWELRSQPGLFKFEKDGEDLPVFEIVNDVLTGEISPEDWLQKCTHLGIADEPLA